MSINSTYDKLSELFRTDNYGDFGPVPYLQYLASGDNTIFSVVDKSGNQHIAEVVYDSTTDQISPPLISEQNSILENLPIETLHEITVKMAVHDVLNLCRSSHILNDYICNNNNFWRRKYLYDFEIDPLNERESIIKIDWKEKYKLTGNVYSIGSNFYGQLGLGDQINRNEPVQIPNIKAKAISAGERHSLLIDLENNVFSFGDNLYGQLGVGPERNDEEITIPTKIPNIKAKAISAGGKHSLLIDTDNNVWAFGFNYYGQLGLGDNESIGIPTSILNMKAKAISAGENHSLLIDLKNNVWSFGHNDKGQLGLGDTNRRYIPTKILGIKAKSISAGGHHSLLIDLDDRVWSFGLNHMQQLGLKDLENRNIPTKIEFIDTKVKAISTGMINSMVIDENYNLLYFGAIIPNVMPSSLWRFVTKIQSQKVKAISAGMVQTSDIDYVTGTASFEKSLMIGLDDEVYGFDHFVPDENVVNIEKLPFGKVLAVATRSEHVLIISLG